MQVILSSLCEVGWRFFCLIPSTWSVINPSRKPTGWMDLETELISSLWSRTCRAWLREIGKPWRALYWHGLCLPAVFQIPVHLLHLQISVIKKNWRYPVVMLSVMPISHNTMPALTNDLHKEWSYWIPFL